MVRLHFLLRLLQGLLTRDQLLFPSMTTTGRSISGEKKKMGRLSLSHLLERRYVRLLPSRHRLSIWIQHLRGLSIHLAPPGILHALRDRRTALALPGNDVLNHLRQLGEAVHWRDMGLWKALGEFSSAMTINRLRAVATKTDIHLRRKQRKADTSLIRRVSFNTFRCWALAGSVDKEGTRAKAGSATT